MHASAATRRFALLLALAALDVGCAKPPPKYQAPESTASTLHVGSRIERTLGPGDEHAYTIQLESGAGVFAQVEQQGIDVVVEVYDPKGRQMARLDSPTGAQGSELVQFTALQSGPHKIVARSLDRDAEPALYVLKVDQILAPAANADYRAKLVCSPPILYDLWRQAQTDPGAIERFAAAHQKAPLIDSIPDNRREMQVTYVCLGDAATERAELIGGPDFQGTTMTSLGRTNLFFASQIVPKDARFLYAFNLYELRRAGSKDEVEVADVRRTDDVLLEMPNAPAQPYITLHANVPPGKTVQSTIASKSLAEDRTVTVYTPAGYDGKKSCNLLIVFDGQAYGGQSDPGPVTVPTPTILDNLIAAKKIGPTVAILVWSMGKRNRDLSGNAAFTDFVAKELVPWARSRYRILPGAKNVVVGGSSLGAHAATYCALTHPDLFGNVLSQSGAYWVSADWQVVEAGFHRRLYPRDTGAIIEAFKSRKRLPIRFYIEVGIYDLGAAMLGSNRELRDVLQLEGYDVDYREFAGGHNYVNWRGSFADGLISLLGRKGD